jgi:sugar transferase (PEP-CTERM/EpsH1 system associated)
VRGVNILLLAPQLPYPPDRGTALRNWGLLAALARRHRVSLLAFAEPGQTPAPPLLAATGGRLAAVPAPAPRGPARRLADLALSGRPDMAMRLDSPAFAARLRDWLAGEAFDVVQCEGLELAAYLDVARGAAPRRPLLVFDDHNAEWLLQRRAYETDRRDPRRAHAALYSLVQWRRLRRFEARACRQADRVLAVSAADAAALEPLMPGRRVQVVPNGIDTATYAAGAAAGDAPAFDLVFTGKMDYRPNVDAMLWFAEAVWPSIRAVCPGATLGVVGQQPHARLAALRGLPGITLTGQVADIRPYVERATVYVAPLRMGGGTRFKLLEAMALGRAIVATRLAAEGLEASDGSELCLADDPPAFAAAVIALLGAPERRAALGARARAHVRAHFDWEVIAPRLEAVYA